MDHLIQKCPSRPQCLLVDKENSSFIPGKGRTVGQLDNCRLQGTAFAKDRLYGMLHHWSCVSNRGRHCMMADFTAVLTVHVMLHMASSWLGCPIALPNFSPKFVNSSNPPLSRTEGRTGADDGHKFRSFLARASRPVLPKRQHSLHSWGFVVACEGAFT